LTSFLVTTDSSKSFDPTTPSFIRSILYALQASRPPELRKAVLLFLPLIGDRWFDAYSPIAKQRQMNEFCRDWTSAVDSIEHTDEIKIASLTTLLWMINSDDWRPRISWGKWKLLEYYALLPGDSVPLQRCLRNPKLMGAVKDVNSSAVVTRWLDILWSRRKELPSEVKGQLTAETERIAQHQRNASLDSSRTHILEYVTYITSELKRTRDELGRYIRPFTDPIAVALEREVGELQRLASQLDAIARDKHQTA